MKAWQILAAISGAIIATVMALASINYNATLGTPEPAFHWLPVSNSVVFSALALAFDFGMIASVYGFLEWRTSNKIRAAFCAALFGIASLFSIHSVRGYIALNLTKSLAPAERSVDIYHSLKLELHHDQQHLERLRARLLGARRRERRTIQEQAEQLSHKIHDTRSRLAQTDNTAVVSPLEGLEWFLALTLWFFNASCWGAWFGSNIRAQNVCDADRDSVRDWLSTMDLTKPQHCTRVFENYRAWCAHAGCEPLAQYSFYARLVELGARKFRDGRNGPTMYVMRAVEG